MVKQPVFHQANSVLFQGNVPPSTVDDYGNPMPVKAEVPFKPKISPAEVMALLDERSRGAVGKYEVRKKEDAQNYLLAVFSRWEQGMPAFEAANEFDGVFNAVCDWFKQRLDKESWNPGLGSPGPFIHYGFGPSLFVPDNRLLNWHFFPENPHVEGYDGFSKLEVTVGFKRSDSANAKALVRRFLPGQIARGLTGREQAVLEFLVSRGFSVPVNPKEDHHRISPDYGGDVRIEGVKRLDDYIEADLKALAARTRELCQDLRSEFHFDVSLTDGRNRVMPFGSLYHCWSSGQLTRKYVELQDNFGKHRVQPTVV